MMTSKDAELYLEDESTLRRLGCESKAERRAAKRRRKQSQETVLKAGKGFTCRDEPPALDDDDDGALYGDQWVADVLGPEVLAEMRSGLPACPDCGAAELAWQDGANGVRRVVCAACGAYHGTNRSGPFAHSKER